MSVASSARALSTSASVPSPKPSCPPRADDPFVCGDFGPVFWKCLRAGHYFQLSQGNWGKGGPRVPCADEWERRNSTTPRCVPPEPIQCPCTQVYPYQQPIFHIDCPTDSQAYYILDELFIGGHLQESSKNEVLRVRLLPRTGCMMGSTGTGRVMDASEGQKM